MANPLDRYLTGLKNLPRAAGRTIVGGKNLALDFFKVKKTKATPNSFAARDEQAQHNRELLAKIVLIVCTLVIAYVVLFAWHLVSTGGGTSATTPNPSASVLPSPTPGIQCVTAPAATPVPSNTPAAGSTKGDPCSYASGVVVDRTNPDDSLAHVSAGLSIRTALISIDGSTILPPNSLYVVKSDNAGNFSVLPAYAGAAWRFMINGANGPIPIRIVATNVNGDNPLDWTPSCSLASRPATDAIFHFASDKRLFLSLSICPSDATGTPVILAAAILVDIPRVAIVAPSVAPVLNPIVATWNYSQRLSYHLIADSVTKNVIGQATAANEGSLLLPLILLLVTLLLGSFTYYVRLRMKDLERLPGAQIEVPEADEF
jgi:flagellar basal body-associated protein FliL